MTWSRMPQYLPPYSSATNSLNILTYQFLSQTTTISLNLRHSSHTTSAQIDPLLLQQWHVHDLQVVNPSHENRQNMTGSRHKRTGSRYRTMESRHKGLKSEQEAVLRKEKGRHLM